MGGKFSVQSIDINEKAGIVSTPTIKFGTNSIEVSDNQGGHKNIIYQDSALDFKWFKQQAEWLSSLDEESKTALRDYTHTGDKFLNMYAKIKDKEQLKTTLLGYVKNARNIFPVPVSEINENNILELVGNYYEKIGKIFSSAPPLTQKMRVFRGLSPPDKSEMSGLPLGLKRGTQYPLTPFEGIISTTYDTKVVSKFITVTYHPEEEKRDSCCIMDIVLNPGVRAIWVSPLSMFGDENEIILFSPLIKSSVSQPVLKSLSFIGGTITPKLITTQVMTYNVVVEQGSVDVKSTLTQKAGKRRRKRKARKTKRY